MKISQLIIRYLDLHQGTTIESHTIQLQIPTMAKSIYGKTVTPATVDREWRRLRSDQELLEKNGYKIEENEDYKGKEKQFKIIRLK